MSISYIFSGLISSSAAVNMEQPPAKRQKVDEFNLETRDPNKPWTPEEIEEVLNDDPFGVWSMDEEEKAVEPDNCCMGALAASLMNSDTPVTHDEDCWWVAACEREKREAEEEKQRKEKEVQEQKEQEIFDEGMRKSILQYQVFDHAGIIEAANKVQDELTEKYKRWPTFHEILGHLRYDQASKSYVHALYQFYDKEEEIKTMLSNKYDVDIETPLGYEMAKFSAKSKLGRAPTADHVVDHLDELDETQKISAKKDVNEMLTVSSRDIFYSVLMDAVVQIGHGDQLTSEAAEDQGITLRKILADNNKLVDLDKMKSRAFWNLMTAFGIEEEFKMTHALLKSQDASATAGDSVKLLKSYFDKNAFAQAHKEIVGRFGLFGSEIRIDPKKDIVLLLIEPMIMKKFSPEQLKRFREGPKITVGRMLAMLKLSDEDWRKFENDALDLLLKKCSIFAEFKEYETASEATSIFDVKIRAVIDSIRGLHGGQSTWVEDYDALCKMLSDLKQGAEQLQTQVAEMPFAEKLFSTLMAQYANSQGLKQQVDQNAEQQGKKVSAQDYLRSLKAHGANIHELRSRTNGALLNHRGLIQAFKASKQMLPEGSDSAAIISNMAVTPEQRNCIIRDLGIVGKLFDEALTQEFPIGASVQVHGDVLYSGSMGTIVSTNGPNQYRVHFKDENGVCRQCHTASCGYHVINACNLKAAPARAIQLKPSLPSPTPTPSRTPSRSSGGSSAEREQSIDEAEAARKQRIRSDFKQKNLEVKKTVDAMAAGLLPVEQPDSISPPTSMGSVPAKFKKGDMVLVKKNNKCQWDVYGQVLHSPLQPSQIAGSTWNYQIQIDNCSCKVCQGKITSGRKDVATFHRFDESLLELAKPGVDTTNPIFKQERHTPSALTSQHLPVAPHTVSHTPTSQGVMWPGQQAVFQQPQRNHAVAETPQISFHNFAPGTTVWVIVRGQKYPATVVRQSGATGTVADEYYVNFDLPSCPHRADQKPCDEACTNMFNQELKKEHRFTVNEMILRNC